MHECWSASPELLELAAANKEVGKWRSLASLVRATDGVPEVAKYCLNKALLARLPSQYGKAGCGAAKFSDFIRPDFIEARKMAVTMDRTVRPWDKER